MDVALASCLTLPEPDPDAAPLCAALAEAGIENEVLAWDDAGADWARARLTLLRSTWNYPLHLDRFLRWAERAASVSTLWNPLPVVRWNSHKSYLLDLERQGVPVAPTVLLPRGSDLSLRSLLADRGWSDVVVKPAVSAASFKTLRVGADNLEHGETHLRELLRERDVLVQQYLSSVETYGERAIVWIDGDLTHAVRKSPRWSGEDESVSGTAVDISNSEAELARRAIGKVDEPIMYGRVDVAPTAAGAMVVMELELIEPSLFFPQCELALERFVEAIRRRLD